MAVRRVPALTPVVGRAPAQAVPPANTSEALERERGRGVPPRSGPASGGGQGAPTQHELVGGAAASASPPRRPDVTQAGSGRGRERRSRGAQATIAQRPMDSIEQEEIGGRTVWTLVYRSTTAMDTTRVFDTEAAAWADVHSIPGYERARPGNAAPGTGNDASHPGNHVGEYRGTIFSQTVRMPDGTTAVVHTHNIARQQN